MTRSVVAAIEERRQALQADLDALRSASERNRLGQFATPNALAIDMAMFVRSVLGRRTGPVQFADPSIGTGSFFSAAVAVFGGKRMRSAVGVEIDPAFCDAARALWGPLGLDVVNGDFTRVIAEERPPAAPNLILANPPYVRHHHIKTQDKERLQRLVRALTGIEVSGLAGLYVYFVLLATSWLAEDGIAAWLVPSEFMDVGYGSSLKRFLTERVTLLRVHRFNPDDVQFGDALVSSAILVLRKRRPPGPAYDVEMSLGGTLARPRAREAVSIERLREARKWTVFPLHEQNDRHASSLADEGPRLADLVHIQRGIATGNNKFFVLDRADARRRGLPERYLRPILPSPRHLRTTVIDANEDGYPRLDRQLVVIDCDLPESTVQELHPSLWAYLQTAEALGVRNGYLVGKRAPWYRQERREPAPFLCTYMGRGASDKPPFRFLWNRSAAIGTNLYLMLYPRNGLKALLREHPDCAADVHAILQRVTGHELRGEGRVYGGGLNKIEPSELGRISAAPFVERWPELESSLCRQNDLWQVA